VKNTKVASRAREITYVAIFAVLIVICSWISIPGTAATVPFTMQTFAVFAAVGFLGGRLGALSIGVYILLGLTGLPVFAGFTGGPGVLLGSTGGYIMGFLLSALVYWAIVRGRALKPLPMALAMGAGHVVCYAFGTAWFMKVYAGTTGAIGLMTALSWCVFPFIVPDLLKIALAAGLSSRLRKHVKR